jgi:hypothetical protein
VLIFYDLKFFDSYGWLKVFFDVERAGKIKNKKGRGRFYEVQKAYKHGTCAFNGITAYRRLW